MRPLLVTVPFSLCVLIPGVARAQSVSLFDGPDEGSEPDILIEASALPDWATGGAESISVVWDPGEGLWVMLMGTRFSEVGLERFALDRPGCSPGDGAPPQVYGVARAFSANGLDWLVDAEPVILPGDNPFSGCGLRSPRVQPAPAWADAPYLLAFVAVQPFDACADGERPWGCDPQPGAHLAVGQDTRTWTEVRAEGPAWPLSGLQQVSTLVHQGEAASVDATRLLLFGSRADGVHVTESRFRETSSFPLPDRAAIRPGTWAWSRNRWSGPSATCGPRGERFQFQVWLAGATDGGTSGLDPLLSADSREWFGDGRPALAWPGAPQWVAWDSFRSGGATYLYHIVPTPDGGAVRLARAGGTGDFVLDPNTEDLTRLCLYGQVPDPDTDTGPVDTDEPDTGDTGDTADTAPLDTDPGADTDVPLEGCYCANTGSGWSGAAALLALVGLAAARRIRGESSRP
jgi:hypothetical protein